MAKIWPVYEGDRPTVWGPWADLPLREAVSLFELRQEDLLSGLEKPPRFGPQDRDLTYAGFKHIVVEVDPNEGRSPNWKPGFYRSKIRPKDAFGRLIRQALASELGDDNVIRLEWTDAVDSQGRPALKITVVIAPDATQKIKNGPVLDALVRLNARLGEMREERTPIVEYVTEAELRQNAGA